MKRLTIIFSLISIAATSQVQTDYSKMVDTLISKTNDYYIFPDKAKEIRDKLLSLSDNSFKNLSKQQFADTISAIFREESNDKHFALLYRPNFLHNTESKKEQQQKFNEINRRWNFGFESVERLKGNIGYINYSGFAESNSSRETLAAAMNFVSNTNSLIIDLRNNHGGDGPMMLLFCSYFFENKQVLSKTYFRQSNKTVKNKTKSKVLGKKYLNKPVYILTNKNTFSAAEALSYNLQQKGVAVVIGETTAGAANPVEMFVINNDYLFFVPNGKETNLTSKKNWEHIGVKPNYEISQENALKKAQILALQKILERKIKAEITTEEIEKRIIELTEELK